MRYRPDIDGLRTLAVVPVVLFHADTPGFGGGFVGVDVFFVISGYLITQIILSDLDGGGYSVLRFYERRIRRIFPALTVVLLFCLAAGYLLHTPKDYAGLAKSAFFAAAFASNFYFWRNVNYFDSASDLQPLLHTWSLSVEEQFYIFYPFLLVGITRYTSRRTAILFILTALSLALASVIVLTKQSAAFYMLPTRAWELLLGALLATQAVSPARDRRLAIAAAFAAVALIVLPVVFYSRSTVFPGLTAVPPTLGAALLIWSGASFATPVHRILSSRPFVLVGQASYSLYLWHFPLLSFAAYAQGERLSLGTALIICLCALAISLFSLKYIERPFRASSAFGRRKALAVAAPAGALVLVTCAAVAVVQMAGVPGRLSGTAAHFVAVAEDENRHPRQCMSLDAHIVPPASACRLGDPSQPAATLLWGDSHAMVTATAMEAAAKRSGQSFLFAATADCPPGLGFEIAPTSELTRTPSYRYCRTYNQLMLEQARQPSIKNVVLSARWSNWRIGEPANPAEAEVDIRLKDDGGVAGSPAQNRAIFTAGFARLVAELDKAGKRVFIVGPMPEPRFDVPHALYLNHLGTGPHRSSIPIADFESRHAAALRILREMEARFPVQMIWPHTIVCSNGTCPIIEGKEPIFFDHNHLSVFGARKTAPLYRGVFAPVSAPR